jgi:chromosome segregation ATPase
MSDESVVKLGTYYKAGNPVQRVILQSDIDSLNEDAKRLHREAAELEKRIEEARAELPTLESAYQAATQDLEHSQRILRQLTADVESARRTGGPFTGADLVPNQRARDYELSAQDVGAGWSAAKGRFVNARKAIHRLEQERTRLTNLAVRAERQRDLLTVRRAEQRRAVPNPIVRAVEAIGGSAADFAQKIARANRGPGGAD